jgi:hypothetical protein
VRGRARGSPVRWLPEEALSKRAGPCTETGEAGWPARDEQARDREVLHCRRWALSSRRLRAERSGSYPGRSAGCPGPMGLRGERSALTDRQQSAEGIVGSTQTKLVWPPRPQGGGIERPCRNAGEPKARTVGRRGHGRLARGHVPAPSLAQPFDPVASNPTPASIRWAKGDDLARTAISSMQLVDPPRDLRQSKLPPQYECGKQGLEYNWTPCLIDVRSFSSPSSLTRATSET